MQLLKTLSVSAVLLPTISAERMMSFPTSIDAAEYISVILTGATVTGSQATSLASALFSVDSKFWKDGKATTMMSHVWSAAAQATDSAEVVASMGVEGWKLSDLQEQKWWKDNVPDKDDEIVSEYLSEYAEAYNSIMATAAETGSEGAAPKCTGMAMAGVAAGVAARVMAVM